MFLLIGTLIYVPGAFAQPNPSQSPAATNHSKGDAEKPFSQDELKSFAAAAIQVMQLDAALQPHMKAAETTQERKKIQQQAYQKMAVIIQAQGMTIQKFNQISKATRNDPQVASRVDRFIKEEQ
jgi:hypothetical protein